MKDRFPVFLLVGALALLVGCDTATAPDVATGADDYADVGADASNSMFKVDRTEFYDVVSLEGVDEDIECLGETVTWHGFADFTVVVTVTPSGNQIEHLKLNYDTATPYSFVGQSSGDVWTLMNGEDISHTLRKPKGPKVVDLFQANEFYATQDGEKAHFRIRWLRIKEADGSVRLVRFAFGWNCH